LRTLARISWVMAAGSSSEVGTGGGGSWGWRLWRMGHTSSVGAKMGWASRDRAAREILPMTRQRWMRAFSEPHTEWRSWPRVGCPIAFVSASPLSQMYARTHKPSPPSIKQRLNLCFPHCARFLVSIAFVRGFAEHALRLALGGQADCPGLPRCGPRRSVRLLRGRCQAGVRPRLPTVRVPRMVPSG
jgi:hypothetical protein